jgi:hypothetical protein
MIGQLDCIYTSCTSRFVGNWERTVFIASSVDDVSSLGYTGDLPTEDQGSRELKRQDHTYRQLYIVCEHRMEADSYIVWYRFGGPEGNNTKGHITTASPKATPLQG